ncbi:hypothetical protein HK097_009328 [Rhizophlyctis rosea]|uniref:Uncharacterized protein n=1 Tax=Rhizophlyctis rosea TaxID=64517 RepID=A0AAD5SC59_9FUNG|nr:hypothetical protein HK097_009328 [Rhizophlyctis rosea]
MRAAKAVAEKFGEEKGVWEKIEVEVNGRKHILRHRNIVEAAEELLISNPVRMERGNHGTGTFADAPIGAIMMWSDKTNADHHGKQPVHAVIISLGNIALKDRHKPTSRRTIAYLPTFSGSSSSSSSSCTTTHKVAVFHACFHIILQPVLSQIPIGRYLPVFFHQRDHFLLASLVADWQEAGYLCGVKSTWAAKRCCVFCLLPSGEFASEDSREGMKRTADLMKPLVRKVQSLLLSGERGAKGKAAKIAGSLYPGTTLFGTFRISMFSPVV